MFTDFESADWASPYRGDTDASTLDLVSSVPGFEPIDSTALRVTVSAGGHFGMSIAYDFSDQIGADPTEVFFRYYLKFNQNWLPSQGGKMPGMSGTYGVAGWGGRRSDGTNGWAARGHYGLAIPAGNSLEHHVPLGNGVSHAEMGRWGTVVWWQDGLLGILEKGRWYSIEQRLVMNTPGQNDGIMETWIDGRLAYRQTNWRWRNAGYCFLQDKNPHFCKQKSSVEGGEFLSDKSI